MITTTFLAWLYLFRNEHFPFVRNMFMVAMGIALVGYALLPTAPPRLLPGEGFTDTLASFTSVEQDCNAVSLLVNKYAAVPSMHCGFALMIAGTAVAIVAQRGRAGALGALSAARLRRGRRHGQPLLARRRRGRARRRCGRASRPPAAALLRPARWSFRPAPGEAAA